MTTATEQRIERIRNLGWSPVTAVDGGIDWHDPVTGRVVFLSTALRVEEARHFLAAFGDPMTYLNDRSDHDAAP